MNTGELARAEKAFREGVRLYPNEPEFRQGLGTVLWRQNRKEEALEAFEKALELAPGNQSVNLFISRATGKPPRAEPAKPLAKDPWDVEDPRPERGVDERAVAQADGERAAEGAESPRRRRRGGDGEDRAEARASRRAEREERRAAREERRAEREKRAGGMTCLGLRLGVGYAFGAATGGDAGVAMDADPSGVAGGLEFLAGPSDWFECGLGLETIPLNLRFARVFVIGGGWGVESVRLETAWYPHLSLYATPRLGRHLRLVAGLGVGYSPAESSSGGASVDAAWVFRQQAGLEVDFTRHFGLFAGARAAEASFTVTMPASRAQVGATVASFVPQVEATFRF